MNVASKDLCRELYELSGWKTPYFFSEEVLAKDAEYQHIRYDLGYLLRKLPRFLRPIDGSKLRLELSPTGYEELSSTTWCATYADSDGNCTAEAGFEDTPEDALTKLAVQLFKQGLLQRGDEAGA